MTYPRLATVPRPAAQDATVRPNAAPSAEPEPETPVGATLLQFQVSLGGSGRVAIVALPPGVTAVEMLVLIGQMPAIGSQASNVPADPEEVGKASARAKLIVPR